MIMEMPNEFLEKVSQYFTSNFKVNKNTVVLQTTIAPKHDMLNTRVKAHEELDVRKAVVVQAGEAVKDVKPGDIVFYRVYAGTLVPVQKNFTASELQSVRIIVEMDSSANVIPIILGNINDPEFVNFTFTTYEDRIKDKK